MFRTLIRFLAVCLLALSPVWGVGEVAARPAGYPVWPSFLSTGCNSVSSSAGGTTTVCGVGGSLLTQVNSGYPCNRLDIGISSFSSGPFIITGLADSESIQNTITVNDTGDYTMDFPGFLVNNSIIIQMSAPDSGSMTIAYIQTIPCPVQPTATNTLTPSNTPTPNPSDTATNTATPGPSHTPTAIPTYTPLPSSHNTFTVTNTPGPSPTFTVTPGGPTLTATGTATATPTPAPTEYDCGPAGYPLLNCNMLPYVWTNVDAIPPTHWDVSSTGSTLNPNFSTASARVAGDLTGGYNSSGNNFIIYLQPCHCNNFGIYAQVQVKQNVTPAVPGTVYGSLSNYSLNAGTNMSFYAGTNGNTGLVPLGTTSVSLGHVSGPSVFELYFQTAGAYPWNSDGWAIGTLNLTFVPDSPWTPAPTDTATDTITGTPTATLPALTATESARETETVAASSFTPTPIPIPGAISTAIPTDTPCPGGCAVKQLTQVPGFATRVLVDTSPFSALEHLSLARSSCQPFGYVQIPVPVIHGTPALGSTEPLSFTWTAPVTHTWDDTNVFSNTALQPCAMVKEIPSFVWDFTYWLSVLMCAVGWFMWLIGFVGRLSGEETING